MAGDTAVSAENPGSVPEREPYEVPRQTAEGKYKKAPQEARCVDPFRKRRNVTWQKKVISFIVILLVFCTAGAAVLIGTSNFGLGFGGMTENPVSSAYALDRAGDIYYVNRTSTGMELVCVVPQESVCLKRNLTRRFSGGVDFTVSGIYVEHDKGIYLTVYVYDPETLFISRSPFRISTRTEPMPGRCSRRRSPA